MPSINFIGGEKGGVGKSVLARVLAQYFIDKGRAFTGFDTDRSHTSFTRFYSDFASPVVVDTYEGLDLVAAVYEEEPAEGPPPNVIVDLAAQTAAPLARWVKDSDLVSLMASMGVTVNFWHVADAGRDSVDLLDRLVATYGAGPNYIVVKNLGRGSDFSQLEESAALKKRWRWAVTSPPCPSCTRPACARSTGKTPAFGRQFTAKRGTMRWACWSVSV